VIRLTHFREKCIGCNYCAEVAPFRWSMDDTDGKSNLRDGREKKGIYTATAGDDEYDQNREAAEICPVNIIRVEKF